MHRAAQPEAMRHTADAVVIGAGVIGCSVAHALAATGRSVLVVDRNPVPGRGRRAHRQGSSGSTTPPWPGSRPPGRPTGRGWSGRSSSVDTDDDGSLARFWRTGSLCLEAPGFEPGQGGADLRPGGRAVRGADRQSRSGRRTPGWTPAGTTRRSRSRATRSGTTRPARSVGSSPPTPGSSTIPRSPRTTSATAAGARASRFCSGHRVGDAAGGRPGGRGRARRRDPDRHAVVVNVRRPELRRRQRPGRGRGGLRGRHPTPAGGDARRCRPHRATTSTACPGPLVADLDLGTYFRGTPSGRTC